MNAKRTWSERLGFGDLERADFLMLGFAGFSTAIGSKSWLIKTWSIWMLGATWLPEGLRLLLTVAGDLALLVGGLWFAVYLSIGSYREWKRRNASPVAEGCQRESS